MALPVLKQNTKRTT